MLRALRTATSWTLYSVSVASLGAALVYAFSGGMEFHLAGLHVSIHSWKVLRPIAALASLGVLLDPSRRRTYERVRDLLRRHPDLTLWLGLGYAATFCCAYKLAQHHSLHTGAYDLAMFEHALHNTLRGQFLHAFGLDRSFFSEHFSPVLLAIVPLYAAVPRTETLLLVESLLVAAAAIPLYRLARSLRIDRFGAALVSALYLSNEIIWRGFAFDFHMEMFAPLALFGLAGSLVRGRRYAPFLWLLFALSIKEDMALAAGVLLAFLAGVHRSRWRASVGMVALCGLWLAIALVWVIPASYPHERATSHFVTRWSHLGASYGEILRTLISDPGYVIGRIVSRPVLDVLGSVAFLPLLEPLTVAAALPVLLLHLTSGLPYQADLGVYYAVPGVALLIVGIPWGIRRVVKRFGLRVAWVLLAIAVLAEPYGKWCDPVTAADRAAVASLSAVPAGDRIAAQTCIIPHLTPSPTITMLPDLSGDPDWIVLHETKNHWPMSDDEFESLVRQLLSDDRYRIFGLAGGCKILRRRAAS